MKHAKLLKLFAFSLAALLLAGCETCPNSVQYADIGIRISPMACVTKSPKAVQAPDETSLENKEEAKD